MKEFASHTVGDRVEFNVGLIGAPRRDMRRGTIQWIDESGIATVLSDDGGITSRDLCALKKLNTEGDGR